MTLVKSAIVTIALFVVTELHAVNVEDAHLKAIIKAARAGEQQALAPLQVLHTRPSAADAVLALVTDKRVNLGIKLRLSEIVSAWPQCATRKTLGDWLVKHPSCDNDELLFFSGAGLLEARSVFWTILTEAKGPPSHARDPERVAIAAKTLGAFQDNQETVVSRIALLLDPVHPHVIRASAADALGGMRHQLAIESLLPQLSDDAIGTIARRSLYRLTGTDFVNDSAKWNTWLARQGAPPLENADAGRLCRLPQAPEAPQTAGRRSSNEHVFVLRHRVQGQGRPVHP